MKDKSWSNTYDAAYALWRFLGKLGLKEQHQSSYEEFVAYTRRVNTSYKSALLMGDIHAKSILPKTINKQ